MFCWRTGCCTRNDHRLAAKFRRPASRLIRVSVCLIPDIRSWDYSVTIPSAIRRTHIGGFVAGAFLIVPMRQRDVPLFDRS
jgi:hypothetical protein